MLVIRLFRVGKKNQPSYKIVVTDKKKPSRAGRFVEQVGFYNFITNEKKFNSERIKYWLSVGVKPSDTVYNLLVSEKIVGGEETSSLLPASLAILAREGKKIDVQKKSKKEVVEEKAEEKVEEKTEEKPVEEKVDK